VKEKKERGRNRAKTDSPLPEKEKERKRAKSSAGVDDSPDAEALALVAKMPEYVRAHFLACQPLMPDVSLFLLHGQREQKDAAATFLRVLAPKTDFSYLDVSRSVI
jgi:hypothetical protein